MENKQLNLSEPENIMGTMDVNPLLIKLSIPMMISMLVQALYNVVDSIFVARVSENALTAVSLAFSLQNLMFAVGIGTGVGVNALLSKSLGEKNQYRANKTAENGLFLALCSYLVFLVLGLTVVRPYFYAQTADADIAEQGIRYLTICCVLSLGMFMQVMNEKLLAATSRTTLSMISQLVGAIVNIILDPIFIFGYCGEALSGTTGAALATVIGQFCGAGVSFYLNLRKNPDIQLDFKGFRPSAEAIKRIYVVGLPSIAMQCVGSVMTFLMNQILMAFTATAVAVFGVYFKLQSFVFMPIFGMNNGMVPIISYNYGARKPERVKKTIRLAVFYAECIMLVGFCIFQFLPDKLLSLFAASDAMLAIGVPALRIICPHFLLAGAGIVLSSVFQALGNGVFSLTVSICRQLVVLIPAAWLLSRTGEVNMVWWAFIIAEVVSLALSLVFMARINRTVIVPLSEKQDAAV
ncbi:MAG: MATE family efflux transporter [Faecalibacterium sp.]